jgi:hypothetical protein
MFQTSLPSVIFKKKVKNSESPRKESFPYSYFLHSGYEQIKDNTSINSSVFKRKVVTSVYKLNT